MYPQEGQRAWRERHQRLVKAAVIQRQAKSDTYVVMLKIVAGQRGKYGTQRLGVTISTPNSELSMIWNCADFPSGSW